MKTTLVESPMTIDEWYKKFKVSTRYVDESGFNDHIAYLKRLKGKEENNTKHFDWPQK